MLVIRNYTANGAVPAYTIVKPDAVAGKVVAGAAAADKVFGVSTDVDAALNDRIDVVHSGDARVLAGAAFAAGDLLMSDASGRAILAAAAAGVNVRTIGTSRELASAAGDIVEIMVAPGVFQG